MHLFPAGAGQVVSIHAPAWGATPRPLTGFLRHKSFNPRTRVGCDRRLPRPNSLLYWFQSTHPRGVRLAVLHLPAQLVRVSIHAPAWGATAAAHARRHALCGFNPRTRVGCDIRGDKEFGGDNWFQSTHPRGVRPQAGVPEVEAQAWFQSTHPRGVRPGDRHPRDHQQPVSIHAPAWGATRGGSTPDAYHTGFNPRTRVGCDIASLPVSPDLFSFNPRTRVGCDMPLDRNGGPQGMGFNPRTRVGCDGKARLLVGQRDVVSIHAPAWGATTRL